jgi:iron complex outermembrane recepter protein
VSPLFMGQTLSSNGFFGYDPAVGNLSLVHSGPESDHDSFTQSALTIEGKVSDFDLVYAGGWLVRNQHSISDYADYSYFYDKFFASGCNWVTEAGYRNIQNNPAALGNCYKGVGYPAGDFVMPQEFVITKGRYTKWSHEFRVSTPQEWPVKAIAGLFAQRQVHEIWEQYTIPGLGGDPYATNAGGFSPSLSIPGVVGNSIWLTDEERVDRDQAAFGQATWDITNALSLTGGIRFYKYKNSLQGFYGYSANYQAQTGYHSGQQACGPPGVGGQINFQPFHGAPCTDLNDTVEDSGRTYRGTVSYKFDRDRLMYATYSTGFRPGGVNRVYSPALHALFPPYKADVLTNYELGWKTQWDNHRLRWNGALFLENWHNFQFLYLGPNSVTVVQNAASAQIKGVETELEWAATSHLLLSGGATFLHAVTTANYCGPGTGSENNFIPGTTDLIQNCPNQTNTYPVGNAPNGPEAPSGTRLPVAPQTKLDLVARYSFPLGSWQGFVQGAGTYQSSTEPLLRLIDQQTIGRMPAYALFDLSGGVERNNLSLQFAVTNVSDERAQLTRFVQCTTTTCGQPYIIPAQPRTFLLKVGQKF